MNNNASQCIFLQKSDFRQADFYNVLDCPINRALRRNFPDATIIVGGKTARVTEDKNTTVFNIGEVRMNGSLMNPKGLGTITLSHIHHAIRYKHFKTASVTLIPA